MESITRYNMARIYRTKGNLLEAIVQLRQAIAIAEAIQSPHVARFKRELAEMEQKLAEAGQSVA